MKLRVPCSTPHTQSSHTARPALSAGRLARLHAQGLAKHHAEGQRLFYIGVHIVTLTFRVLLEVSLLLNLEQTLSCLLVIPMIHEVTPSGKKLADPGFPLLSHSICPEANVQACRLGTRGLSRIGSNYLQNTGTRARLGIPISAH